MPGDGRRRRRRRLLGATLGAAGTLTAVLAAADAVHHRATTRRLGTRPGTSGTGEVVVVLGFRNRGRHINLVNRWRVRAALRSLEPELGPSLLVLSGGAAGGEIAEAELMARYARELGYGGPLEVEDASLSTWENVRNVLPLLEHADRIKLVSNALHAEKAREYLRRHRPDLAERLVTAHEHRPGDLLLLEPVMAVIGLRNLRRLDRQR